ncbi:hypothetical protein Tco_1142695 [Tanacetum coccineum]
MLVVGNYVQWRSRIRRYIATRLNHDLINHCIYNGPYEFKMMDHPAKEAIGISEAQPARRGLKKYSYANSKEMWLAIERLMQDFEANFPAIVYNDVLTSNENVSPEPTGQELFSSYAWRRLFEIQGPLVREFMLEFFNTCKMSDTELRLDEDDTLCLVPGGTIEGSHITAVGALDALGLLPKGLTRDYGLRSIARFEEDGLRDFKRACAEQRQRSWRQVWSRDFFRFTVWAASSLSQLLDAIGATYKRYSKTHVPYQRRMVRHRIGEASTSAAPLNEDQPDP